MTTRIEPASEPEPESQPDLAAPEREAVPDALGESVGETEPAHPALAPVVAVPQPDEIAALEAEVAALRAGNRVLTEAMRVLLDT